MALWNLIIVSSFTWFKHGLTGDKRENNQPWGKCLFGGSTLVEGFHLLENKSVHRREAQLMEERILVLSIRRLGRAENLPL